MTADSTKQSPFLAKKPTPERIKMVTNLEALKSSSIVSVIERYIPLRKNGANFIACCPFHSEKSPSFVVSEAKGMFKCFGCGKGGDALSFIKEYEKIDFNEAVKRLSELTGITLEYDKAHRVGKSPHEVLEKINELAKRELQKNAAIVEYLAQRGITREICEKYDIGLVPSKHILLANFSAQELVESGFANAASAYGLPRGASTARNDDKNEISRSSKQSNNSSQAAGGRIFDEKAGVRSGEQGDKTGASIDAVSHKLPALSQKANAQNISIPMRERIGIAIRNPQHKIVAFVARTHPHYNFPPNAPKYINSKESYFYKKTQILYLYSNARASIQAQKAAFVVEGYIDSILLHENGFKNAIATGGTAFNVQHLNLLTRLDCEVIFCFDNDKSGMAANFRAVKVCFGAGFYRVKVAILQNKDTRGKLCKDINEALLCDTLQANTLDSNSTRISSLKGGQGGLNCEVTPLIPPLTPQAPDDAFKVARERATIDCMDSASAELSTRKAESTSPKLEFKYLSGYEFFIKWLYKNKDKQQAFNEIKAAISACQNFYDKQEFLDTACKLTGVPQEYFTQDKIPTKQPKDDYSKLVASILHSQECAYIASELDLSFLPKELEQNLRIFLASQKMDSSVLAMDCHADKSARNDREKVDSRIFDDKVGLRSGEQGDKTGASIDAVSHKLPALSQNKRSGASAAQQVSLEKAESIFKEFIEVEPLDSNSFYQHYCDLYLAHLTREQTKARAKKDLKLVLALSEKIAQVQRDIQAQKAF